MKNIFFKVVAFTFFASQSLQSQSTLLGLNPGTGLTLSEYYNHGASEWIKLFKVKNSNWNYGGVAGSLYFVDYQGKGASRIDFVFPQSISANQKPQLKLAGNSAVDILWYTLPAANNDYYEVYIKTPSYHVGLTFLFRATYADSYMTPQIPTGQNWNWCSALNPESIQTELGNGNVGIGVMMPNNKLDVNGTIHSKEVKVDMTGWSDYVFKKKYILPTLEEVERHIAEKGHLENIPSEEEVLKNGINLGEMDSKLLQKIEELTLYSIEQSKKIEEQSKEIESLKSLVLRVVKIENALWGNKHEK